MRVVTCETCNGEGRWEQSGHVERYCECADCRGAGELEVVDPAPEVRVVDLLAEVRRLCR